MAESWLKFDPRIGIKVVHPLVSMVWDDLDKPPVIEIGPEPTDGA